MVLHGGEWRRERGEREEGGARERRAGGERERTPKTSVANGASFSSVGNNFFPFFSLVKISFESRLQIARRMHAQTHARAE